MPLAPGASSRFWSFRRSCSNSRRERLRDAAVALNLVIWTGFAAELAFVLSVSRHWLRPLRAPWLDAAIVALSFPITPAVL
ncbi:MAG: hypothetical protein M3292_07335 [Actinomycetota bacterium]|nr:hypothetical protein [Actinomycetota bacterium]